jgi:Cd2+/Zn2+-exporting ATPase
VYATVKALNDASMGASVHQRGQWKAGRKWPSPWTIASGLLLGVSFFQYLYHPLRWVALGSVAVGIPPLVIRSIAAMKSFILDINILMLIAGDWSEHFLKFNPLHILLM